MKEVIALIEAGDFEGAQAAIAALNTRGGLSGEEQQIIGRTLQRAKARIQPAPETVIQGSELPEPTPEAKPQAKPKAGPKASNPQKKSPGKGKK